MSIADLMKAMADAGAPFEAILIAVRALEEKDAQIAARDAEADAKRAKDAARSSQRRALLPKNWASIRSMIFDRDGWSCTYCGSKNNLQCDHVTPLCKGGTSDPSNLTTACQACNASKGGRDLEEWRAA